MKNSEITDYFNRLSGTLDRMDTGNIEKLAEVLLQARERGSTIFIFGNGGSGATASHMTGDFLKGVSYQLEKRFRVQCLNDNVSGMMAISNDLTYEEIFVEQLKNFLRKDDIVIGISGSGNSMNVVKALQFARSQGAVTVSFCGFTGGKVREHSDLLIHAPIQDMEITEDIHFIVFHALKQYLVRKLKGDNSSMGGMYDARVK